MVRSVVGKSVTHMRVETSWKVLFLGEGRHIEQGIKMVWLARAQPTLFTSYSAAMEYNLGMGLHLITVFKYYL